MFSCCENEHRLSLTDESVMRLCLGVRSCAAAAAASGCKTDQVPVSTSVQSLMNAEVVLNPRYMGVLPNEIYRVD